jgi:hypothetical protein
MFLLDTILLSPFQGVLWVAEKIRDAAGEQETADADALTEELRCLYLDLERGQITEEEFAARETVVLDRLDRMREAEFPDDADHDEIDRAGDDDDSPEDS